MIIIEGKLYDGTTSRARDARLEFYGDGSVVLSSDGEELGRHPLKGMNISDRLGDTPRYVRFPDGAKFETADNDAVDRELQRHRLGRGQGLLHELESHYWIAGAALVVIVLLGTAFFTKGVPALSKVIAFNLPSAVSASLAKETFTLLDERIFDPSEVDEATRERLREGFGELTRGLDARFKLHFRGGGELIGANAFALPDGTVVMTDELVALAEDDRELLAVLAHEAGHVVNRHGLRQVLQNSIVTLFILYATGDASNLVAALPAVLVQAGYSRAFEREADGFTLELLRERGIEPGHFATILRKLEEEHSERREREGDAADRVFAYLSTHPPTEERVRAFE